MIFYTILSCAVGKPHRIMQSPELLRSSDSPACEKRESCVQRGCCPVGPPPPIEAHTGFPQSCAEGDRPCSCCLISWL